MRVLPRVRESISHPAEPHCNGNKPHTPSAAHQRLYLRPLRCRVSMPRAVFLGHGEPAPDGPGGIIVVDQLVGRAGEIGDGVGVLRVERNGGADHQGGGAQQLLGIAGVDTVGIERGIEVGGAAGVAVVTGWQLV